MFIWGIHMFTYRGDYTKFMGITGMYCFLLCIPVLIIGFVLITVGCRKKGKS